MIAINSRIAKRSSKKKTSPLKQKETKIQIERNTFLEIGKKRERKHFLGVRKEERKKTLSWS